MHQQRQPTESNSILNEATLLEFGDSYKPAATSNCKPSNSKQVKGKSLSRKDIMQGSTCRKELALSGSWQTTFFQNRLYMKNIPSNGGKWRMKQWIENKVKISVPGVSQQSLYDIWNDRTSAPKFMDWITSVEVVDEKLSRWRLSSFQFNRQWELTWLAKNLTPIPYQKIHWVSVPGSTDSSLGAFEVPNKGAVRIYPEVKGECIVELSISYEVIDVLGPFASALSPLVNFILQQDMERFKKYAIQMEQDKASQTIQ
eukprot:TRINITY_DN7312_c0_g1_i3.p1 TRINITY_DN7312_c0_g1~~TRINITY_DN7312_c0_g1_i3.p1  ORF type:complete len:257 (+),score=18.99 TRINITY_DN7312_c0_g1_i3:1-771(+)